MTEEKHTEHGYAWLSSESQKVYDDCEHVMSIDLADIAVRYHEHMSKQAAQRMDQLGATNATLLKELAASNEHIAELKAVLSEIDDALLTCKTDGSVWKLDKAQVDRIRELIKE